MIAKTYKSTNNFTSPESLSNFGIPVIDGREIKYLGLEEFNFCPILQNYTFQDKNVAFIPCFSSNRDNIFIEELHLFYLEAPHVTIHYATLFGVSQIHHTDVPTIRQELIEIGFQNHVHNSVPFQNVYGPLFNQAIQIWDNYFDSNNTIANGNDLRFVLNTFYERIEFHHPNNFVEWAHLKFARPLYNDIEMI